MSLAVLVGASPRTTARVLPQGPGSGDSSVPSVCWGLPGDWLLVSLCFPSLGQEWLCSVLLPRGHSSPGTATPTSSRRSQGRGQPCVMLPKLLSKATVTGSDQDVPCHGGSSIYGIATCGILRCSHGFMSLQTASRLTAGRQRNGFSRMSLPLWEEGSAS